MADDDKKRQSQLTASADVLQALLQNRKSPLTEQFVRWRVWNAWPEVVGAEIAKNTLPVGYLKGTLYIWVKSGPRMQELLFLLDSLRDRINKFAGAHWVKSIRLTLDRKSVPQLEDAGEKMRDFVAKTSAQRPESGDGNNK